MIDVLAVRIFVGRRNSFDVLEALIQIAPDLDAFLVQPIELLELDAADRGLDLVHPEVVSHLAADVHNVVVIRQPVVGLVLIALQAHTPENRHFLGVLVAAGREHPALAESGHVLQRVEAEGAEVPERAGFLPLVLCAGSVRRVLDDCKPMLPRQLHNWIHIAHLAAVVDEVDRPRARRDLLRDALRIRVECSRVHVRKYGRASLLQNRLRGSDESQRRDDHLIARLDAEDLRRQVQTRGAVTRSERVLCPTVGRELVLELGDDRPHGERVTLQRFEHRPAFFVTVDAAEERVWHFQLDASFSLIAPRITGLAFRVSLFRH